MRRATSALLSFSLSCPTFLFTFCFVLYLPTPFPSQPEPLNYNIRDVRKQILLLEQMIVECRILHWCTDSVDLLLALMIDKKKKGLGWVGFGRAGERV